MKLTGFIQVSTSMGSFFCRAAELQGEFVMMEGPVIVTLQMVEDPKTKQPQRLWNKDTVDKRYMNTKLIMSIDILDPAKLDAATKEVYTTLSGITL